MKKTAEDFMQWLELQVGDKVKIETLEPNKDGTYTKKYEVYDVVYDDFFGFILNLKNNKFPITNLIGLNFDIFPKPKKVGELKCGDIIDEKKCSNCPLKMIDCVDDYGDEMINKTLYEILDYHYRNYQDQEIYDLLKKKLDKVVVEE